MNRVEEQVNEYAKELALYIIKDYRNNLGLQKIFFLDKIGTDLKISLTKEEQKLYIEYPQEANSEDIALEILKRRIPNLLFSYLIDIKQGLELNREEQENARELEEGLRSIYTRSFCEKHHFVLETKEVNDSLAKKLLNINADIDKNSMVFQTNYDYMKHMYFISTGNKLIENKIQTEKPKVTLVKERKKENGFFDTLLMILIGALGIAIVSLFFI